MKLCTQIETNHGAPAEVSQPQGTVAECHLRLVRSQPTADNQEIGIKGNSGDALLNVVELAGVLKRPKSTIYYWSSQLPGFPKIVVGRGVLFRVQDVLDFFAEKERCNSSPCNPAIEELKRRILSRSLKTKGAGRVRFSRKEK